MIVYSIIKLFESYLRLTFGTFIYYLSSIKSDCPCLWFYYVKWSCSNKSPSDVANLIHRFTARHSSSHLTANFLHLYFSMDQIQNGSNQIATDLLHNIRKEFTLELSVLRHSIDALHFRLKNETTIKDPYRGFISVNWGRSGRPINESNRVYLF